MTGCAGPQPATDTSSPTEAPSTSNPSPSTTKGATTLVFNQTQTGTIQVANPLIRDHCGPTLAECSTGTAGEGTDYKLVRFSGVSKSSNFGEFVLTWDPSGDRILDFRTFDEDGQEISLQYVGSRGRLEAKTGTGSQASEEMYQLFAWMHAGTSAATFEFQATFWRTAA